MILYSLKLGTYLSPELSRSVIIYPQWRIPSFQLPYGRPVNQTRRSGISNPVSTLLYAAIIRPLPVLMYLSLWLPLVLSGIQAVDNQRVTILSAVVPRRKDDSAIGPLLEKITYEDVACIISSFDNTTINGDSSNKSPLAPNGNGAYSRKNRNRSLRKRRTPEELAELKERIKCNACGKTGNWKRDSDWCEICDDK